MDSYRLMSSQQCQDVRIKNSSKMSEWTKILKATFSYHQFAEDSVNTALTFQEWGYPTSPLLSKCTSSLGRIQSLLKRMESLETTWTTTGWLWSSDLGRTTARRGCHQLLFWRTTPPLSARILVSFCVFIWNRDSTRIYRAEYGYDAANESCAGSSSDPDAPCDPACCSRADSSVGNRTEEGRRFPGPKQHGDLEFRQGKQEDKRKKNFFCYRKSFYVEEAL